jgi:hypothetical protein
MASNSASLSAVGPLVAIRSLGRSLSAQFAIVKWVSVMIGCKISSCANENATGWLEQRIERIRTQKYKK